MKKLVILIPSGILIASSIKMIEIFKTKNINIVYSVDNSSTILRIISIDIVNKSFIPIRTKDIKLKLRLQKDIIFTLAGNIVKDESTIYASLTVPAITNNHLDILIPPQGRLHINEMYLRIDFVLKQENIKALLIIETYTNIFQDLLYFFTFGLLAKKEIKINIQKIDKIQKRHEGYLLPLIDLIKKD